MHADRRLRHDAEARRAAAELFEAGVRAKGVSGRLSIPLNTVRQWLQVWRALGSEELLSMGRGQRVYTYEQRVGAARAVVDGGATKVEAMARYGVAAESTLTKWCRAYREGGAEALRPRPKGRPRGSGAQAAPTREQELEREVRRLRAEVAYLKKLRSLAGREGR